MLGLQRNQLVWLHPGAWQSILARTWDTPALSLLHHWAEQQLPLVVARQREGTDPAHISLGLPAPLRWERRKLALEAKPEHIARTGHFPWLHELVRQGHWSGGVHAHARALQALGLQARVYGSHSWQFITGMPCVHAASDLDLCFEVPDLPTAMALCNVLAELAQLDDGMPMDGEILFRQGSGVAWRELQQLAQGHVQQVLARDRHSLKLVDIYQLRCL